MVSQMQPGATMLDVTDPLGPQMTARLDAALDRLFPEALSLLEDLIAINSINPLFPGIRREDVIGGEAACASRLGAWLAEAEYSTESVAPDPDRANLVAYRTGAGGGRSLVVNGHLDTVAPFRPRDWLSGDPWRPLRQDGRLYGLGATDMKGGLVAAALAFRAISATGLRLKGDLQLHAVVGEETMSHEFGTSAVIEAGFGGDAAIVVEPTSSPRPLSVNPISGGNFNLQVDVKGFGTHSGNRAATIRAGGVGDAAGVNAVEKAILVVQALQRLEQEWGITKQHPAFPPGLFSLVPGVFHGDAGVPSVGYMAESATVGYLVWYHPHEAPEAVRAEIERFVHHAAQLDTWLRAHPPVFRWESNWPAFDTPVDHPLVRALVTARAEVLGPLPAGLPDTGAFAAVCDASFLAAKGIPAVVFGPGDLREAHAINESVEIEEIRSAARVIARAAVRWCGVA